MDYVIGIDMGGTAIKAGAFSRAGRWLGKTSAPTLDGETIDGHPAWAVQVRRTLQSLEAEVGAKASAVGLTCPGLAARDRRTIVSLPNRLLGLEGFDWTAWLGRSLLVPVINDAHAALLGEVWQGAAQGKANVVMLTLGTGVGGAILIDGRLLRGHHGRAGEFGHTTVDFQSTPSNAGMPGGLETFIGNATVSRRSDGRFSSTKDLVAAYVAGDAEAARIWIHSVRALATALASLANAIDPEAIILGGGIAEAGEALWRPLEVEMDRVEWRPGGQRVQILKATLGDWAGAMGAAQQAMEMAESPC